MLVLLSTATTLKKESAGFANQVKPRTPQHSNELAESHRLHTEAIASLWSSEYETMGVCIAGISVSAIIDSGAQCSALSSLFAKEHNMQLYKREDIIIVLVN